MFNPEEEGFTPIAKENKRELIKGRDFIRVNGDRLYICVTKDTLGVFPEEKPRLAIAIDGQGRVALYPNECGVMPITSNLRCTYMCYSGRLWQATTGFNDIKKGDRFFLDVEDKNGEALIFTPNGERMVRG